MLSIVLRRPDAARGRPRDYFKDNDLYESVFGNDEKEYEPYDLNLYLKSTVILRRVQDFLDEQDLEPIHRRNLVFYLAMYAISVRLANPYVLLASEVIKLDVASLSDDFLSDCYKRLWKLYDRLANKQSVDGEPDYDALAKGPLLLKAINADLKKRLAPKKSGR